MQAGKYLFIDIGSTETKILEANVSSHNITILKSAEMRDMSLYVSEAKTIMQIEGFCMSLKKTLADAGIRTTNAIVCSSIFAITMSDLTNSMKTAKQCATNFDSKYGRATNFSKINDWQYMGEIVSDTEITNRIMMATGNLALIKGFVEAMRSIAGITVMNFEPSASALANLQILYKSSFDLPSLVMIDIGGAAGHCQYFKNNTFVSSEDIDFKILHLTSSLAESTNVAAPKIKNLIYQVGFIDTEDTRSEVAKAGIEPAVYFETLATAMLDFAEEVKSHIVNMSVSKKLENIRLVLVGGIAAIPGFGESFRQMYTYTPHELLTVDTHYNVKEFRIINKLNRAISGKFMVCIGMMTKIYNEFHTINLVPKELMIVDSSKVVNTATLVLELAMAVAVAAVIGTNILPTIDWVKKLDVPNQLAVAETEYQTEQANCKRLITYVDNLNSINNSLTPFITFIRSCENSGLKIATIDSANVLNQVVVTTPKDDAASEAPKVDPLENLVIRGYAKSSQDITAFFTKLSDNEAVRSANMNGVREIELTEGSIFIFEISVEVTD